MAALAEFERDLLRERDRSGIAAARKRGVVFGRQLGFNGQAGAGIGISAESLPGQAAHARVLAASVLVPLRWAARRLACDSAAIG